MSALDELLAELETGELGDPLPLLAYLAGQQLELPAGELAAARRRALLVLASGGDPTREPELDGAAAKSLARDLYSDARLAELVAALDELTPLTRELPRLREAATFLASDPDLAWRLFVLALLAEELDAEDADAG
jgi:hypothetical protein